MPVSITLAVVAVAGVVIGVVQKDQAMKQAGKIANDQIQAEKTIADKANAANILINQGHDTTSLINDSADNISRLSGQIMAATISSQGAENAAAIQSRAAALSKQGSIFLWAGGAIGVAAVIVYLIRRKPS